MGAYHNVTINPRPSCAACRAFTLVELLAVVAVIALLVALLLPTLGKARAAGRIAACMSNVRQLAMASMGYVSDNAGQFSPTNTPDKIGQDYNQQGPGKYVSYLLPGAMWMDPIWERYLNKNIAVMECPDQTSLRNTSSTYQYMGPGGYRKYYPGYLVNRQTLNHVTFLPTRLAQWSRPNNKVLHADSGKRLMNGAFQPEVFDGWGPLSAQWWAGNAQAAWSGAAVSGRHWPKNVFVDTNPAFDDTDISGGSNVVFADLHGEFRDWFATSPWRSITANGTAPTANAGKDLFIKYWDPDGDGNQFTP